MASSILMPVARASRAMVAARGWLFSECIDDARRLFAMLTLGSPSTLLGLYTFTGRSPQSAAMVWLTLDNLFCGDVGQTSTFN